MGIHGFLVDLQVTIYAALMISFGKMMDGLRAVE
jgi:hypothetical protein